MSRRRMSTVAALWIVLGLLAAACSPAAQPTTAPPTAVPAASTAAPPTEAPAPPTQVPAAQGPTECNVCSIHVTGLEEAWSKTWFDAWKKVAGEKPHGLTIHYDSFTENSWGDDAERALRNYAETGKCDIIWAHSTYSDQVKKLNTEFPNIMWAVTGSGNEGLGGNVYWIYEHGHEGAYLLGIIAGSMTKSNVIGFVGGYPADDVNDALNGFLDGAKSVNPKVQLKYTFIESWYDPPKAKEAALAQIAAGADFIYAERLGVHEACADKGVYALGHFEDQNYLAPGHVASSTVINWEPSVRYMLEEWWKHKTSGEPFNASKEPLWWGIKDGGVDIAPYHEFGAIMPQEVKDAVAKARQAMIDGTLVVPLKTGLPE